MLRSGLALRLFSVFFVPGAVALPSAAKVASRPAPLSPYERAEQFRASLENTPENGRTRRDYESVLEAFRAVYHDDPASPKADACIYAVAELLAEQGRSLHDQKSFHDAIGQYEFLRREYPASHYRIRALLNEGEIYAHDLNDRAAAKSAFEEVTKKYPASESAATARAELKELQTGRQKKPQELPETARSTFNQNRLDPPQSAVAVQPPPNPPKKHNTVLAAAVQSQQNELERLDTTPQPTSTHASTTANGLSVQHPPPENSSAAAQPSARIQEPALSNSAVESRSNSFSSPPSSSTVSSTPERPPPAKSAPASATNLHVHRGRLPLVTGVRHWSTPVYTRVAIDLQDQVEYEASRVPDPDRIFFDLHGAQVSPELIGKSVEVIDDGFLKRIRVAQFSNDVTRVVLDVSDVSEYSAFFLPNPYRLIIDVHGRKPNIPGPVYTQQAMTAPSPAPSFKPPVTNPPSKPAHPTIATPSPAVAAAPELSTASATQTARDVAALGARPDRVKATAHPTTAPIAASVPGTTPAQQPGPETASVKKPSTVKHTIVDATDDSSTPPTPPREADSTPSAGRSSTQTMTRALGLKIGRIVVDAGHGGHDSGTLGPDGIEEKDVVLDVALRLGKLLRQRLGADVIYTRSDDTFIPLETRTAIANKAQADLFISIHANSSSDPSARGVETYYLNFTSSPESLELAARENAVSQQSIHQLSDLVKKIALHDKIDESREFAADVDRYLYEGLDSGNPGLKDRGVKQAPFVVLIGANMPSILAEISFLTNPEDARELRESMYRERIAESLYRGVARYVGGLSGVKLAENSSHNSGD